MRTLVFISLLVFSCATQAQSDSLRRPILFVHGFLASGDTWSGQIQRFRAMGYPEEWLEVFDWNTLGNRQERQALQERIKALLAKTGQSQVYLVGHSAGGGLCYSLLKDSLVAQQVRAYVHVGSVKIPGPAGSSGQVSTLNLYSTADRVTGGQAVVGATNEMIPDLDHLQIAAGAEAFSVMYRFFHGAEPALPAIPSKLATVSLAGRVVFLGDNKPVQQATVTVYRFDQQRGKTLRGRYVAAFTPDSLGNWSIPQVPVDQALEFDVAVPGSRNLHYYFEPFSASDKHVYLRCLPQEGMAARMLAGIPASDSFSVIAVFTQFQAVVAGRDSLAVQQQLLSTPKLMPEKKTIIASFLYDNGDRQTSLEAIPGLGTGVFLQGVDMAIPTRRDPAHIRFNGRDYRIPCLPSSNDIQIVVFR